MSNDIINEAPPPLRIVHVDNAAEDLEVIRRLLKQQQEFAFKLTQLNNLAELGAYLRQDATPVDVILVDLGLDESDGIDTVKNVLSLAREIPIIPITGNANDALSFRALRLGAQDYLVKDEVNAAVLARAIRYAIERHQLVNELNAARAHVEHLATHDPLTGLLNRAFLEEKLRILIAHAARHKDLFAVLFLDLDGFKLINDTHGHGTGDAVLREVAQRIQNQIRRSDCVSRIGGDEFICILQNLESPASAANVAEKIIASISTPMMINGIQMQTGTSVGIALWGRDGEDPETLLKNADTALYHAKEHGRGQFAYYDPKMHAVAMARLEAEREMRRALAAGQLAVRYQPVLSREGQLVACEALLRWMHPEKGELLPDMFLGQVEQSGFIVEIGEYVLNTVMQQYLGWRRGGAQHLAISVNVAARHFSRPDFVSRLRSMLRDHALPEDAAPWLNLEIKEQVFIKPTEHILATLQQLAQMEVKIAIDDFGTGYSCLFHLKDLPIHSLKIDRAFIHNLNKDENDKRLLEAILQLSQSLSLQTVAEGVEDEDQRVFLKRNGCDALQGFLFSPAVSAAEIEQMAIKWPS